MRQKHWCPKCGRKKLILDGNPRGKHYYFCPNCNIYYDPFDCLITTTEYNQIKKTTKSGRCEHQGEIKRHICLECGEEI